MCEWIGLRSPPVCLRSDFTRSRNVSGLAASLSSGSFILARLRIRHALRLSSEFRDLVPNVFLNRSFTKTKRAGILARGIRPPAAGAPRSGRPAVRPPRALTPRCTYFFFQISNVDSQRRRCAIGGHGRKTGEREPSVHPLAAASRCRVTPVLAPASRLFAYSAGHDQRMARFIGPIVGGALLLDDEHAEGARHDSWATAAPPCTPDAGSERSNAHRPDAQPAHQRLRAGTE